MIPLRAPAGAAGSSVSSSRPRVSSRSRVTRRESERADAYRIRAPVSAVTLDSSSRAARPVTTDVEPSRREPVSAAMPAPYAAASTRAPSADQANPAQAPRARIRSDARPWAWCRARVNARPPVSRSSSRWSGSVPRAKYSARSRAASAAASRPRCRACSALRVHA
ncbi:hypothetical protein ACFQ60_39650 [Streptomyces zhihengii]